MAKSKIILNEILFDVNEGSFFGISNPLKEYQLAYHINHILHISLYRETDFEIYMKDKDAMEYYPFLVDINQDTSLTYVLLNIKNDNSIPLHKELKLFDNLFFIFGRDHLEKAKEFKENCKNIPRTSFFKELDFTPFSNAEIQKGALSKEAKATFSIFEYFKKVLFPEMEYNFMEISKKNKTL